METVLLDGVSLWTCSEVAIAVASLVHQMISRSSVAADAIIPTCKHELFGGAPGEFCYLKRVWGWPPQQAQRCRGCVGVGLPERFEFLGMPKSLIMLVHIVAGNATTIVGCVLAWMGPRRARGRVARGLH